MNSKSASIIKFLVDLSNGSARFSHSSVCASLPAIQSDVDSKLQIVEETIEKERPQGLEIKTVSGMKTKVGHVIVMLLLIGLFEKSKKAVIHTPLDLLCFSASVLLCSGCLYLLSRLTEEH
ncbi:hypothetical protein RDI58_028205 [Solanum bulbocastanum]|uniref:Uncharacterized protein n=1 Tax=Solanum bulbocastanum TaxID=147425 RepID=A0AAN8SUL5_SOLBU